MSRWPVPATRLVDNNSEIQMKMRDLARFFAKVEVMSSGCWRWLGTGTPKGYGTFSFSNKPLPAHRAAYRAFVGTIRQGLHIDHLCRNRRCVNPAHLEAVTPRENVLRGDTIPAAHIRQTHCKRGHEFTPENTYKNRGTGRTCKACILASNRRIRLRRTLKECA